MSLTYREIFKPKVVVNSLISGGLVFFGACSSGDVTLAGIGFAFAAAAVAFLTQLRNDIFPPSKKGAKPLELFHFI